jgi:hypothetical protein
VFSPRSRLRHETLESFVMMFRRSLSLPTYLPNYILKIDRTVPIVQPVELPELPVKFPELPVELPVELPELPSPSHSKDFSRDDVVSLFCGSFDYFLRLASSNTDDISPVVA